jgi:hypothetical protein
MKKIVFLSSLLLVSCLKEEQNTLSVKECDPYSVQCLERISKNVCPDPETREFDFLAEEVMETINYNKGCK